MSSERSQYLQALGIDEWVLRNAPVQEAVPAPIAEASLVTAESVTRVVTREQIPIPEVTVQITTSVSTSAATPEDVVVRWMTLEREVATCTKCSLHATRIKPVFGVGNRNAEWLVIGEAPGADEDRQGEPFVGRAGQLLNSMLRAIGLAREMVYIANILKSRPPGNRDPKPEEVTSCLPYLKRQIALIQPKIILAVGRIAAQNLLATDTPLARLRGRVHHFGDLNTPLVITYHPAYLLRSPTEKRKAWEDLKFARSVFRQLRSQA